MKKDPASLKPELVVDGAAAPLSVAADVKPGPDGR
jgi:hypothetical protein